MGYLMKFPIHTLKIDRSFIRDVAANPDHAAITDAIIAMARSLRLTVVAEGVETRDQLNFLARRGCQVVQGYLFSPPVAAEDFQELLSLQATRLPPPATLGPPLRVGPGPAVP
jgi:EAL domain-containing protein (putative c-di-GMP-specific phosphodiesterase class I)